MIASRFEAVCATRTAAATARAAPMDDQAM